MNKLNWTKEKPILTEECILLIKTLGEYGLFEIKKVFSDVDWYYGIFEDGEEWGVYKDLNADFYAKIEKL